jgi:hypothetical protein
MAHKTERPDPTGIGNGAKVISVFNTADLIHTEFQKQAASRISRRFFLTLATAATVAELACIGGAA